MALDPGTRFGPYEIVGPIGAGGMGEVYKASDTRLNRTVAIKVLQAYWEGHPDMKERFDREARTIASLTHPNICTLHDIGREGDTDFLVMEYLEGKTLAERLERGALPLDEALKVAIAIADAMDKAHRMGIVHRDLKPSNVMLTPSGPKLLDFGLAKLNVPVKPGSTPSAATGVAPPPRKDGTSPGMIVGTLQYMAPERAASRNGVGQADVRRQEPGAADFRHCDVHSRAALENRARHAALAGPSGENMPREGPGRPVADGARSVGRARVDRRRRCGHARCGPGSRDRSKAHMALSESARGRRAAGRGTTILTPSPQTASGSSSSSSSCQPQQLPGRSVRIPTAVSPWR